MTKKKSKVIATIGRGNNDKALLNIIKMIKENNDELKSLIIKAIELTNERLNKVNTKRKSEVNYLKKKILDIEMKINTREFRGLSINDAFIEKERVNFILDNEATTIESLRIDVSRLYTLVNSVTIITKEERSLELNEYFSNRSHDTKQSNRKRK